jgi:PGF-CTERM protein
MGGCMRKLLGLCLMLIFIYAFFGIAMADINQDVTLTTKYETSNYMNTVSILHSNSILFPDNLQKGDILKVNVEVLSGNPIEIMLQKWTCINVDSSHTNCGWPGFFEGSNYVDGDPHYYNVEKQTFSKTISDPGQYRLFLIGSTDDTTVHVTITSITPTTTPTTPNTRISTPSQTGSRTPGFGAYITIVAIVGIALLVIWKRR